MKEHPIIFNSEMVKAILEGKKTQTRRPITSRTHPIPIGDRLWVRETWLNIPDPNPELGGVQIKYKATDNFDASIYGGWKPSIHMPRWASRIILEIIDTKVEQLQKISKKDAIAEGMEKNNPIIDFRNFWDSLYKKPYRWEDNPWVYIIKFKKI